MWVTDQGYLKFNLLAKLFSSLGKKSTFNVQPSFWEEHCTECSAPDCYESCPLFMSRPTGGCRRFQNGIQLIDLEGSLCAEIIFKKWGKLQTSWINRELSIPKGYLLSFLFGILHKITRVLKFNERNSERFHRYFKKLIEQRKTLKVAPGEYFLRMEINSNRFPIGFMAEILEEGKIYFRQGFNITSSNQIVMLPIPKPNSVNALVQLYPIDATLTRITFRQLEIVKQVAEDNLLSSPPKMSQMSENSAYVKCVVWDLDRTVWQGVLQEMESLDLIVRDGIKEILGALNERGIISVVASKNDYDSALKVIQRLGLESFFVGYAINWGAKSESLRLLSTQLNLSLDSFLFVDDSPFERAEVLNALPTVRVCDETEIFALMDSSFLNPPQSEESKGRNLKYKEEAIRIDSRRQFNGSYSTFVRESNLVLDIFRLPKSINEFTERALELLLRTNQLNISGKRYTRDEFYNSLKSETNIWLMGKLKDNYGDYGSVLIARITSGNFVLEVKDFALSCRAAERFVEPAFINFIRHFFGYQETPHLVFNYKETPKNGPIKKSLESSNCEFLKGQVVLKSNFPVSNSDLVRVNYIPFDAVKNTFEMLE